MSQSIFSYALCVLAIILSAIAIKSAHDGKMAVAWGLLVYVIMTVIFSTLIETTGSVPVAARELTVQLDSGVPYQVVSSVMDNDSYVVLVKDDKTLRFRTIRVKTKLPEFFKVINGQVIAIIP